MVRLLEQFGLRIKRQAYKHGYRVLPRLFRPPAEGPLVLVYHHVADDMDPLMSKLGITVRRSDFEQQIAYLTRFRRVVPLSQIREHLGDPRCAAVTIDDGLKSVATAVLPVIEKYACPVKLFVPGAQLDQQLLWTNKLSYLLCSLEPAEIQRLAGACLGDVVCDGDGNPAPGTVFDFVARFDPARTPQAIDEMFEKVYRGPRAGLYLGESDLRELARHPLIEIGSHTRDHYPLHRLGEQQVFDQVVVNHEELRRRIGSCVRGFCVPFGYRSHFTPPVLGALRQVDDQVLSAYGGRVGNTQVGGLPEIRRIGASGNLGQFWYHISHA